MGIYVLAESLERKYVRGSCVEGRYDHGKLFKESTFKGGALKKDPSD
jgi:hypothetical protein